MNAWHRLVLFLLATITACAETPTEVPPPPLPTPLVLCLNNAPASDPGCNVTDDSVPEWNPKISGNRIVWKSLRGPQDQPIMLYDLGTDQLTQITPDGTYNTAPAIDGDRIVFARQGRDDWEFYSYHIPTRTETRFAPLERGKVLTTWFSISGDRVVWKSNRDGTGGRSNIFLHDFVTGRETRITREPADPQVPSIVGDIIAWADGRDRLGATNLSDVYMYDLTTGPEQRITVNSTRIAGPSVTADGIIWGDVRGGGLDLYEYRFAETPHERLLVRDWAGQAFLVFAAHGPYIAWVNPDGDPLQPPPTLFNDVFLSNTETGVEVKLTNLPGHAGFPALSADYVVWQDYRNGNADVYIARLRDLFP